MNAIHTWTITVTDTEGKPVTDGEITVDGGMPAHGHGLPTTPEGTKNLGDRPCLVEGVKFSMPGDWVVTFIIKSGGKEDVVVLDLNLSHHTPRPAFMQQSERCAAFKSGGQDPKFKTILPA